MCYSTIESQIKDQGFTNDDLPLVYTNEDGEHVMVGLQKQGDQLAYVLSTYQKNNWIRINVYYEDGSYEEMYDR